jgi:hypothetical protein
MVNRRHGDILPGQILRQNKGIDPER